MATKSKNASAKAERAAKKAALTAERAPVSAETVAPVADLAEQGRAAGRALDAAEVASASDPVSAVPSEEGENGRKAVKWMTDEAFALRQQDDRIQQIEIAKAFPGRRDAVKNGTAEPVTGEEYLAFRAQWTAANPGKSTAYLFRGREAVDLWRSEGKRLFGSEAKAAKLAGKSSGITAEELRKVIADHREENGLVEDGESTRCVECHQPFQPTKRYSKKDGVVQTYKDGSPIYNGDYLVVDVETPQGVFSVPAGVHPACVWKPRKKATTQEERERLYTFPYSKAVSRAKSKNAERMRAVNKQKRVEAKKAEREDRHNAIRSGKPLVIDTQMRDALIKAGILPPEANGADQAA